MKSLADQTKYQEFLAHRDPAFIQSLMPVGLWLYRYYFQVKTDGWEHIPEEQVLFVGSHNGGLAAPDMTMMMVAWFQHYGTERLVYGLMHPKVWQVSEDLAELVARTGAIPAHPRLALTAFEQGASVLVYPGGAYDVFRPYYMRHQIHLAGNRAFIKLALKAEVPIVPVISVGAHETLIVLADFYQQAKHLHEWGIPWLFNIDPEVFPVYIGLPWGLSIGPLPNLPWPHPIHIRICPAITFRHYGLTATQDPDYIEECYQTVLIRMQTALDQLVQESSAAKACSLLSSLFL